MGTFLIVAAVFSLATLIFQYFWKAVLKFFFFVLQKAFDVVKKIIVAVRRAGKVMMILYKRHRDGKVYKVEYKDELVDEEDIPEGLKDELDCHEQVIVKEGDIDPSEF